MSVTDEEKLATEFESYRPYLHAIAFRVLGSHPDADDAVQEAWLRLARAGGGSIEELRGWLTTVTGRICLDLLRRRGTRGEEPLKLERRDAVALCGRDQPRGGGPARGLRRSRALRRHGRPHPGRAGVVRPARRVRDPVRHDRRHPRSQHPGREDARHPGPRADPPGHAGDRRGRGRPGGRRGVPRGSGPGRHGGLLAVLAPEAELRGIGPQGPFLVRGAEQIARGARVGARPGTQVRPAVVDGLPGLLVIADGQPVTVLAFTVASGAVTAIRALTDPDRLAQIVPSWVA